MSPLTLTVSTLDRVVPEQNLRSDLSVSRKEIADANARADRYQSDVRRAQEETRTLRMVSICRS